MANPIAKMNLTKMLAVSLNKAINKGSCLLIFLSILAVDSDPNRAPDCDPTQCVLPDCFCSADGTRIPGNIEANQVNLHPILTSNYQ